MTLGPKVIPPLPDPPPLWRAHKPGLEIGPGGMLRTCVPLPPLKPPEPLSPFYMPLGCF